MNILRQGKYMASDEKCFEEKIFIGVCAPYAMMYSDSE